MKTNVYSVMLRAEGGTVIVARAETWSHALVVMCESVLQLIKQGASIHFTRRVITMCRHDDGNHLLGIFEWTSKDGKTVLRYSICR